jgi:hypothetical protein
MKSSVGVDRRLLYQLSVDYRDRTYIHISIAHALKIFLQASRTIASLELWRTKVAQHGVVPSLVGLVDREQRTSAPLAQLHAAWPACSSRAPFWTQQERSFRCFLRISETTVVARPQDQ